MEGARSINDAAQGVAVCKIGLLIKGLEVCTVGKVDDFGRAELFPPILDKVGIVVVLGKDIGLSVEIA